MAPRPLESREAFIARLRAAADRVASAPLRFGGHHFSHVVVVEDGVWRVRRLVLEMARAEAFRAQHGRFMPEDAEALSEPGHVVLEAPTLEGLIAALPRRWPMA
jgi:hypothetical protein